MDLLFVLNFLKTYFTFFQQLEMQFVSFAIICGFQQTTRNARAFLRRVHIYIKLNGKKKYLLRMRVGGQAARGWPSANKKNLWYFLFHGTRHRI